MVSHQEVTVEIARCIEEFRANQMEARLKELHDMFQPNITNLNEQMKQVDITLKQVRDQFGIEKVDMQKKNR